MVSRVGTVVSDDSVPVKMPTTTSEPGQVIPVESSTDNNANVSPTRETVIGKDASEMHKPSEMMQSSNNN